VEQRLGLRAGLHLGAVLSDGILVTGDAVHLAARVAASADAGQIRLTQASLQQLPPALRLRCRVLEPARFKGFSEPVALADLEWRDPRLFPTRMRILETGLDLDLPSRDLLRFGRLAEHEGRPANDVVLTHPDPEATRRISRWHFELCRLPEGTFLRAVSQALTEIDGRPVLAGAPQQVRPGSEIRVAGVLTLRLLSPSLASGDETMVG